jgi:hypothetical protein
VKRAPGVPAVLQLDTADLDYAVSEPGFKTGRLGVEDDLTHGG